MTSRYFELYCRQSRVKRCGLHWSKPHNYLDLPRQEQRPRLTRVSAFERRGRPFGDHPALGYSKGGRQADEILGDYTVRQLAILVRFYRNVTVSDNWVLLQFYQDDPILFFKLPTIVVRVDPMLLCSYKRLGSDLYPVISANSVLWLFFACDN